MRRLRLLGVGVIALVGLIGAVPTASAGGPPVDNVTIIGPVVQDVACDGTMITRTQSGWYAKTNPTPYHLTWVYENTEGKSWTYIDTGVIRVFERNGDSYVSLSGRSVNVGPGDTTWVGHWEMNETTQDVWRVGLGLGDRDALACSMLAPSS